MGNKAQRPLSPHLTAYKWGPHMTASIAHRVMGTGLATVGTALFTWWLAALATGPQAYATFLAWVTWPPMLIFPIGLTFAFFLHLSNGLRHFVMDMGAGYELKTNKLGALAVLIAPFLLTAAMWLFIFMRAI
jgi:succinate dehydrogenase / fumarate reductase, cytochrome b subunit